MDILATSPPPRPGLALGCLVIFTACSQVPPEQIRAPEARVPALVLLAERGDFPAIDTLLTAGAAPDPVDGCHWTPLMKASLNGHFTTARRLLDAGGDPNAEDKGGYTALMLAASRGHGDLVHLLIERGADLDRHERRAGDGSTRDGGGATARHERELAPVHQAQLTEKVRGNKDDVAIDGLDYHVVAPLQRS